MIRHSNRSPMDALTDTDPTAGQFGFDSYKLADVVTPQIVNNVRRHFPVGPDWMYQY